MSRRVEQLEVENEALAELDSTPADRSLEEQIAALERPDSDAMLDDLRRRAALEDHSPKGEDPSGVDASLEELKRKLRSEG
jgi:phage shock protein A